MIASNSAFCPILEKKTLAILLWTSFFEIKFISLQFKSSKKDLTYYYFNPYRHRAHTK